MMNRRSFLVAAVSALVAAPALARRDKESDKSDGSAYPGTSPQSPGMSPNQGDGNLTQKQRHKKRSRKKKRRAKKRTRLKDRDRTNRNNNDGTGNFQQPPSKN
jgi:hypothetical protein